jgi:hypothetical protein
MMFDRIRWISLSVTAALVMGLVVFSTFCPTSDFSGEFKTKAFTHPLSHEQQLTTVVQFSTGEATFFPASSGDLFSYQLLYKIKKEEPKLQFVPSQNASLFIDIPPNAKFGAKSYLNLGLSTVVKHHINLTAKTSRLTLHLGGIPIESLNIKTGAGALLLDFNQPNPVTLNRLVIESGAAKCTISDINNARVSNINLVSRTGLFTLDFSGQQVMSSTVKVSGQMDRLTLMIPKGVQVMLILKSQLLSINAGTMVKRDPLHYVTPQFDPHKPYAAVYVHVGAGQVAVKEKR